MERLRLDRLPQETEELRRKLVRWAQEIRRFIQDLEPPELPFLNDRAADNWRPLLQVAMAASSSFQEQLWLNRAIEAARLLAVKDDDEELGTQLLRDLRTVFEERQTNRLSSSEIVDALSEMEDRPWPEYRGKPITKKQLASVLRRYDVTPDQIKISGEKHRGYKLSELDPLFKRYCGTLSGNSLQSSELEGTGSVPDKPEVPDRYGTRTVPFRKNLFVLKIKK